MTEPRYTNLDNGRQAFIRGAGDAWSVFCTWLDGRRPRHDSSPFRVDAKDHDEARRLAGAWHDGKRQTEVVMKMV